MSVRIRLQRKGATHRPFYHVVATDSRNPRDGRFIERLGYYDPTKAALVLELKEDRLQYWYGMGATLSDQCARLVKIKKIKLLRQNMASKA